jgi:hypothetical protein
MDVSQPPFLSQFGFSAKLRTSQQNSNLSLVAVHIFHNYIIQPAKGIVCNDPKKLDTIVNEVR